MKLCRIRNLLLRDISLGYQRLDLGQIVSGPRTDASFSSARVLLLSQNHYHFQSALLMAFASTKNYNLKKVIGVAAMEDQAFCYLV